VEEDRPYRVVPVDDTYVVVGEKDLQILSCRDAVSAEHYVVLLSEAYRRGYRYGFREAKQ
jgi:hypothetical protein